MGAPAPWQTRWVRRPSGRRTKLGVGAAVGAAWRGPASSKPANKAAARRRIARAWLVTGGSMRSRIAPVISESGAARVLNAVIPKGRAPSSVTVSGRTRLHPQHRHPEGRAARAQLAPGTQVRATPAGRTIIPLAVTDDGRMGPPHVPALRATRCPDGMTHFGGRRGRRTGRIKCCSEPPDQTLHPGCAGRWRSDWLTHMADISYCNVPSASIVPASRHGSPAKRLPRQVAGERRATACERTSEARRCTPGPREDARKHANARERTRNPGGLPGSAAGKYLKT